MRRGVQRDHALDGDEGKREDAGAGAADVVGIGDVHQVATSRFTRKPLASTLSRFTRKTFLKSGGRSLAAVPLDHQEVAVGDRGEVADGLAAPVGASSR